MRKYLKLRWLLLLLLIYMVWRMWKPMERPDSMPVVSDVAAPLGDPTPMTTPHPANGGRRLVRPMADQVEVVRPTKHKRRKRVKPIVLPTLLPTEMPTAVSRAQPLVTPTLKPTPKPRQEASVLESVAFKNEEEVLGALGEPDLKYEHEDRVSWYYSKVPVNRRGKPVCPEVQFFDGEARVVIMWSPEVMKDKIEQARQAMAEGKSSAKGPQTFTFMDSFKYLGVGTPSETVLDDLGAPDSRRLVNGREEWYYETLVVENGVKRRLTVVMKDDKVVEVRGGQI